MAVVGDDDDLVEQILVRSNVKDLIRFKSVRKSWYSLLTSPRFINLHLKHSYNEDRCNNELGHRRIISTRYDNDNNMLVGSSNGLVCVISNAPMTFYGYNWKLYVGNPLTREVRQLDLPRSVSSPLCWGFGYNLSRDDYEIIIVGAREGENKICVQVLSLRSDVWRVIGEVKYRWFLTKVGTLCNGALQWIVRDENMNKLVAYDLSKEKFKEISQPEDARYECTSSSQLGVVEECLCIYRCKHSRDDRWVMKNYNVKQSWDLLLRRNRESNYDIVHYFTTPNEGTAGQSNLHWDYIQAPIFVQSLVSPHLKRTPKRARYNKRNAMRLIKGDPTSRRPSA